MPRSSLLGLYFLGPEPRSGYERIGHGRPGCVVGSRASVPASRVVHCARQRKGPATVRGKTPLENPARVLKKGRYQSKD